MQFLRNRLTYPLFKRGIAHLVNPETQVIHDTNFSSPEEFDLILGLLERYGWPDAEHWWLWRDHLRQVHGHYGRFNATFTALLERHGLLHITEAPFFARPIPGAPEGSQEIQVTPELTVKRNRDEPENMRLGRFFSRRVNTELSEDVIRELVNAYQLGGYELNFATTGDEIVHVYEHGPDSCMRARGHSRGWSNEHHPVRVYESPDLAVAYLTKDGLRNRVLARTVVNMQTRTAVRFYGDPKLSQLLVNEGFTIDRVGAPGNFREDVLQGARLKYMPLDGTRIVAPYLDASYQGFTFFDPTMEDESYIRIITPNERGVNFRARAGQRGIPIAWHMGNTRGVSGCIFDDRELFQRRARVAVSTHELDAFSLGDLLGSWALHDEIHVPGMERMITRAGTGQHTAVRVNAVVNLALLQDFFKENYEYLRRRFSESVTIRAFFAPSTVELDNDLHNAYSLINMPTPYARNHSFPFARLYGPTKVFPVRSGENAGERSRNYTRLHRALLSSRLLNSGTIPYASFSMLVERPNDYVFTHNLKTGVSSFMNVRNATTRSRHIIQTPVSDWATRILEDWNLLGDDGVLSLIDTRRALAVLGDSHTDFHVRMAMTLAAKIVSGGGIEFFDRPIYSHQITFNMSSPNSEGMLTGIAPLSNEDRLELNTQPDEVQPFV